MNENDDMLDYGRLIDEAMHVIVKKALILVADTGLPGDHHFYITFMTQHPGVMIADEMKAQYPDEMTIVIQHQFWGLEVEDDRFTITLSFDNTQQNLTIPFASVTSFADPSVKFGLQFRRPADGEGEQDDLLAIDQESNSNDAPGQSAKKKAKTKKPTTKIKASSGDDEDDGDNVVALDSFRKK
jgi:hypothetical protein